MTEPPSWMIAIAVCGVLSVVGFLWFLLLLGRKEGEMQAADRIRLLLWSHLSGLLLFSVAFLLLFLAARHYNMDYNEALSLFPSPLLKWWATAGYLAGYLLFSVHIGCFLAVVRRRQASGTEK